MRAVVSTATPTAPRPQSDLPWSGAALGSADLSLISAFGRPRILGLIGLTGAGKTTALATLYILLSRGFTLAGRTFAGSLTLQGWESLAMPMRLPPAGTGLGFPDHTTSTDRHPGLLHLAFRLADGVREDVLLADAPGEWFREWAEAREAPTATGARWLAQHADAFAVLTDSQALAGEERGVYRAQQVRLVRRVAEEARGRPVTAVWAKADVEVPEGIRTHLATNIERLLPGSPVLDVTARPGQWDEGAAHRFLRLFETLLSRPVARYPPLQLTPVQPDDPLLAFRGSDAGR